MQPSQIYQSLQEQIATYPNQEPTIEILKEVTLPKLVVRPGNVPVYTVYPGQRLKMHLTSRGVFIRAPDPGRNIVLNAAKTPPDTGRFFKLLPIGTNTNQEQNTADETNPNQIDGGIGNELNESFQQHLQMLTAQQQSLRPTGRVRHRIQERTIQILKEVTLPKLVVRPGQVPVYTVYPGQRLKMHWTSRGVFIRASDPGRNIVLNAAKTPPGTGRFFKLLQIGTNTNQEQNAQQQSTAAMNKIENDI